MDFSSYPINKQQLSTATEINSLSTTATEQLQLTVVEQNLLFEDLRNLVNNKFKAWYCQRFKQLGRERVLRLAAIARADAKQDSARYFSWMLKNNEIVK